MDAASEKYPRTMHFPWSNATKDDRIAQSVKSLLNTEIIITEKLDGSNLCFESSAMYARSHSGSPQHVSFDVAKAIYGTVKPYIVPGIQYFGEYCYAVHSIQYKELPASIFIFGIRKVYPGKPGQWLAWQQASPMISLLNLTAYGSHTTNKIAQAPVIWKGAVATEQQLQRLTEAFGKEKSIFGGDREGIVVRRSGEFSDNEFPTSIMKWVRKDHVQTDEHWSHKDVEKQNIKQA